MTLIFLRLPLFFSIYIAEPVYIFSSFLVSTKININLNMSEGFEKSLHILLIKNILSGISVLDNDMNFNNPPAPSKHYDVVNFIEGTQNDMEDKSVIPKVKVINENISSTNSLSNFSNLLENNWPSSFSLESVYNDNYNDLYQTEEEFDDFLEEQKECQLEMMFTKNKFFVENRISENEIKGINTQKFLGSNKLFTLYINL